MGGWGGVAEAAQGQTQSRTGAGRAQPGGGGAGTAARGKGRHSRAGAGKQAGEQAAGRPNHLSPPNQAGGPTTYLQPPTANRRYQTPAGTDINKIGIQPDLLLSPEALPAVPASACSALQGPGAPRLFK